MQEVWNDTFYDLFREAVGRYHGGNRGVEGFFTDSETRFLLSIGCRPNEMFDYVFSYAKFGVPSPTTVMLIAAARRDYFLTIQNGIFYEGKPVINFDLPKFSAEYSGLPYLPRILAIARGKLQGSLGQDVMYCAENDQRFFKEHGNIHPADFLRVVWAAGDNDAKVYDYVRKSTLAATPTPDEPVAEEITATPEEQEA